MPIDFITELIKINVFIAKFMIGLREQVEMYRSFKSNPAILLRVHPKWIRGCFSFRNAYSPRIEYNCSAIRFQIF